MGFPCCHIGSVIKSTPQLLELHPDGFPLSSVRVFWFLEYYLYGLSTDAKFSAIRDALYKLRKNDAKGVDCPTLPLYNYPIPF